MSSPNIKQLTRIEAHSKGIIPEDTNRNLLIDVPPNEQMIKVNNIVVTNLSSNPVAVTIEGQLSNSTYIPLVYELVVPTQATLLAIDRTTAPYLLDSSTYGAFNKIYVSSGSANDIAFSCSYDLLIGD